MIARTDPAAAPPPVPAEALAADPFAPSAALGAVDRFRTPAEVVRDAAGRVGVILPGAPRPAGCARPTFDTSQRQWMWRRRCCGWRGFVVETRRHE